MGIMSNSNQQESLVIGITGGIGSGKTAVATIIESLGFKVVSMDDIAKEEMMENPELKQKLIDKFGEIVYSDGNLNKTLISEYIFNAGKDNKKHQEEVNQIVHPFAIDEMMAQVEELIEEGEKMVFVESALIFESGLFSGYDYVVSVFAPIELAIQRVMQRNNISQSQVLARMELQMSPQEKIKYADFTIDNKGTLQELETATKFIVSLLADMPPKNFDEEEE